VDARLRVRLFAASLALVAAFLWATYYLFVLAVTPGTPASAVLFYPFLGGGVAYVGWVAARGEAGRFASLFRRPSAYLRAGLLLGMQLSVLAATYLTGPVDASLLSLLGDVVATPLIVGALFVEHRPELRSPLLLAGLALSFAGGGLAIAGGHGLTAVHDLGWVVLVAVPVCVAFFFVLSARAGTDLPVSAVVAQSMVTVVAASALVAPVLPGGLPALAGIGPRPLALLLANGLLSFFLAPVLYFRSLERAGLVFPPMLMTGIPVFTLLLAAAILGLTPAPLGLLGVPVAALGGVIALAAGAREAPPA
jgi:drug/metabolite transporter (DMT)-like permease